MNDQREDYMRAKIIGHENGLPVIELFNNQDSSLLTALSAADCLVKREPFAVAISKGAAVGIIMLQSNYPDC